MATLQSKLEIKLDIDPTGAVKGATVVSKNVAGIGKAAGQTSSKVDGMKKALSTMWRISGGIVLFNIIRKITHAIEGLTSTVLDFDEQMRNVTSITHQTGKDFQDLTDKVIDLALDPAIKDGPALLAAGLYEITSAGFNANDALVVLKASAYAATAGVTTTAVAADALTTVLNAYGKDASFATEYSNTLFEAVFVGKMTFEQLAGAIGNVIPTAASLHLSLVDITGAMAALTLKGLDADTAATYLNGILVGFLKPTEMLTAAVQAHGYATAQDMLTTLGFADTMTMLNQIITEGTGNTADYIADSRAMRGVMSLLGGDMSLFQDSIDKVAGAQEGMGATQEALNEQMKAASFQIAVFKKNLQILAVLGFGLIAPYLAGATTKINKFVSDFIISFRHFRDKGYSFLHGFRAAFKTIMEDTFGPDTTRKALYYFDKLVADFFEIKKVVLELWPYVKRVLVFMVDHLDSVIKITAGVIVLLHVLPPLIQAIGIAWKIVMFLIEADPIVLIILAIIAVVILLVVAWKKNWFNIQGITKWAMHEIGRAIGWIWGFLSPIYDGFKKLVHYIHQVATHSIEPKDLRNLPKWMQPVAIILGRITKMVRIFILAWKDQGFIAALMTIPTQIRALGRALSGILTGIGFENSAKFIQALFYQIAKVFSDVVTIVDDVVHGKWRKALSDLWTLAKDFLNLIILQYDLWGAEIVDAFNAIPWGTIFHALHVAGSFALKQIWRGMRFAAHYIWEGIKWVGGKALDAIEWYAKGFFGAGQDLLGAIWWGISTLATWLYNQIGNLIQGVVDKIGSYWNSFFNMGYNLVTGLWAGVQSLWYKFTDWLGGVWDRLPKSLKKLWNMASPSKLFGDIGHNAMKGLQLGFEKGSKNAANSLREVTTGMSRTVAISVNGRGRPMAPSLAGSGGSGGREVHLHFGERSIVAEVKGGTREEANRFAKHLWDSMRELEAAG